MRKLICALIGVAALVASATTYIQTSSTGTAPWKPVKDSVSQAHLADSARHAPPSAYADSSRTSRLADSAKRAGWAPRADSARAAGISDTAKKAGNAANSLALGGIPAAGYGTLAQDTAISKKVASDTATVLRTGIASAITTSEAYATARISDSLTANARAWTTLTAAKSSIHDTATVLRTYIGSASTTGNAATATKLSAARTIATSGDVTGTPTNFDGAANITIPTALPTLLTAGSAGSATTVPTLTWDAKGRLTAVGSAAISIPHTQISDWSTATSSFLTANQPISLTGAVTGSGTTPIATSFANTHLAGINQDLATTSSPTFNYLTLTNRLQINSSQWGAGISQDGQQCDVIGYYNVWDANKLFINTYNNGVGYGAARFAGVYLHGILTTPEGISTTTLTASGLITANGGISGNLTGHASLDIPLTGSAAITGSLISSNASNLGSASLPWGSVYGTTLYEGGVALSSKYLQANQPISLTGAVTGSGTTSIATSFANTHLAGINQDLTTTSSPTFASATIGNGIYRAYAGANPSMGSIYAPGVAPGALNYVLAWEPNGNTSYLSGIVASYLCVNGAPVITATSSGASVAGNLTASGLITANGGISGNLTGHASLDIPLTGSVAVTGSIQTTQGLYAASGLVGMYSIYDNIFTIGNNARNIQVNNTTGETNFNGLTSVSMPGSLTVSGTFSPAVNIRSVVSYTITSSDQGKMILSNGQLSLPESGIPTGFWCIVNWHVGGGGVKFGPTTSGTNWYLRGTSITTSTSIPFSGIVSWDGYTWYAG